MGRIEESCLTFNLVPPFLLKIGYGEHVNLQLCNTVFLISNMELHITTIDDY